MIPYQTIDAAAHDKPRGNLSDLYPRWVGARELLLRGWNPYGEEVTREAQKGYYGRVVDGSHAGDPRDQQAFAYPAYVVFALAPTVHLPFAPVQRGFFYLLIFLTAASAVIWLRVLGVDGASNWRGRNLFVASIVAIILTLGSLPVMQGLKLQQLSLLVAGLIAIAVWLLIHDHPIASGIVLALAAMKPQLVVLLLFWLGIWTLGDVRRRYQWAASFCVAMALQICAAEWYLPHWIPQFWRAVREYRDYTGAISVLEESAGRWLGRGLEALAFILLIRFCWRARSRAANTVAFARMTSMVLAFTVLLIPTDSVYNQVLLLPALLVLFEDRATLWRSKAARVLLLAAGALVAWPWISSVALATLSFIWPEETIGRAWAVPFWTALLIPVGVAAVMLVNARPRSFGESAEGSTS
ncbi:MAG: glycosyltransferase family 87 protein [Terriglobales bacterium]